MTVGIISTWAFTFHTWMFLGTLSLAAIISSIPKPSIHIAIVLTAHKQSMAVPIVFTITLAFPAKVVVFRAAAMSTPVTVKTKTVQISCVYHDALSCFPRQRFL